jgi:predicted O-methyltransferase YrrM
VAPLAIVSAADSKYFALLRDLVASIRNKPQGQAVPLFVLDAGLSPSDKSWLAQQLVAVVAIPWPYDINVPGPQRALAMRCRIPTLVPGHHVYLWLDADTWVQDWAAVELYRRAAQDRFFCMTAELDRSYDLGDLIAWNIDTVRRLYGHGLARHLTNKPLLNAGVFAGRGDAPHWAAWRRRVEEVLSVTAADFFLDQTALNVVAYADCLDIAVLPPHYNWTCHRALPCTTADGAVLLDPQPPYQPLGIVHLTHVTKSQEFTLRAPNGGFVARSLCYSAKPATATNPADPTGPEVNLALGEATTFWAHRATQRLRRVAEANPRNLRALVALGRTATLDGEYGQATRAFRRAAALRPDEAGLHAQLGAIYLRQGRCDEASAAFHHALELASSAEVRRQLEAASDACAMPAGDYVAPGLLRVSADGHFPNMIVGNPLGNAWPYLRQGSPHNWYVDRRNPTIGFVSRDEAHILFNTALRFEGMQALEIGCFLGFSTCHLALGGVQLDVIDPVLRDADVMTSVAQSLISAGVMDNCRLIPDVSPAAIERLGEREGRRWSLAFIDGDHEREAPRCDAEVCERFLKPDALVLFHDLLSPHVAAGFRLFRERGWKTRLYRTSQIMGVAWRGGVEPVEHVPDPTLPPDLPPHLAQWL